MKKAALFLILILYTITTIGVGIKGFYCCHQLTNLGFSLQANDTSTSLPKNKQKHCCNTQFSYWKVKDQHVLPEITAIHPPTITQHWAIATPHFLYIIALPTETIVLNRFQLTDPPNAHLVPLYLFDCVYRI